MKGDAEAKAAAEIEEECCGKCIAHVLYCSGARRALVLLTTVRTIHSAQLPAAAATAALAAAAASAAA
eukprot:COSAG06_NODE_3037_length_5932_cov_39.020744_7_plen_68_part_00